MIKLNHKFHTRYFFDFIQIVTTKEQLISFILLQKEKEKFWKYVKHQNQIGSHFMFIL